MSVRRVALVTGGGRGIGAAVARLLAARGCRVVIAARTPEQVADVAADVGGVGVAADLADPAAVDRLFGEVGPVDILVNNAAVLEPVGAITTLDPDAFRRALDANVTSAFLCLRRFLPSMLEAGWGRVVGVSSSSARQAFPTLGSYCAGKAAFEHLHMVAAAECAGTGVAVNVLWPGGVDTAMQAELRSGAFRHADLAAAAFEQGRLRAPADVAPVVADLCAEECDRHGTLVDLDAVLA